MKRIVRVYKDREAVSRAGAEGFIHFSNRALEDKEFFTIAVSGGTTPSLLYEVLADEYIDRVQWRRIHIFWGDERYVPQRDRLSNFRMFHKSLLDRVHIPLGNVHPMPTHRKDPNDAARDYERFLRSQFPGDWPVIDIIMLGMGGDGHIASLFPHSPALDETERWVVATEAPVEPLVRLTFTLPVINAATDVCFVLTGVDKAEAFRRALMGPPDARLCPASGVRPVNGQLIWWVDRDAASLVDPASVRDCEFEVHDTGV